MAANKINDFILVSLCLVCVQIHLRSIGKRCLLQIQVFS